MTMVPASIVKKLDAMIDRLPLLEAQVKARNAAQAAQDAADALKAAREQQARTDALTQDWRIKADDALRPTGVATPAPVLGETPRQYMLRTSG